MQGERVFPVSVIYIFPILLFSSSGYWLLSNRWDFLSGTVPSFSWMGAHCYQGSIWKLYKNKNCTPWKLYWFPFSSQSHNTGKWPQIQLHCIRALFSLHSPTTTSNFLMQTMIKKKTPLLHKNCNDSNQHLSVCSSYRLKKTPTKQHEAATAYRKVQSSQRLIYSYKGQPP